MIFLLVGENCPKTQFFKEHVVLRTNIHQEMGGCIYKLKFDVTSFCLLYTSDAADE